MPKKKSSASARTRSLKSYEKAFLFEDTSYLPAKYGVAWGCYEALIKDTGPLLFGDRSRAELLKEFPQYAKKTD